MEPPAPQRADYAPGSVTMRLTIQGPGWAHELVCSVPHSPGRNRERCDRYSVAVDGEPWGTAGLVEIFAHARGLVPRRLSRRELETAGC